MVRFMAMVLPLIIEPHIGISIKSITDRKCDDKK